MDLTVWSVFWGTKYDRAYVYALKESVEAHLATPHTFRCITAEKLPGIDTRRPPVSYSGWWQKIGLFAPLVASGPSLYFDLDVVITGELDYLVPYAHGSGLAAPANWAQSGHGGIQSSVMAWPGNWHDPYRAFNYPRDSARLWGDQEFLWEHLGENWTRLPGVGSYKYHVRGKGVPEDMRVCVFHGKPDPHEVVTDQWISPYISTRLNRINAHTGNGLSPVSAGTG